MEGAPASQAAAEELSEQTPMPQATAVADSPAPAPLQLEAPVKLVIWDLDEVLWQGVLSEGEVELDPACAETVRTLNRRGIVNSICSKNDPEDARARLEREGLWEEFVFASIAWTPKGPRIAQIIEDMQLRPVNVLFIDDNVTNLGEARHYVPGLQVAEPNAIAELLSLPQCVGKDDSALSRLAQYRVLETKTADRAQSADSNEDFLRSCDIRVQLRDAAEEDSARLLELVNRSNQLNFTKSRITESDLEAMLADEGRETRAVQVSDRYGDYGMAGFYSVHDGRLDHFVFSCRILHMGVEQWLYARLGKPELQIAGEVASSLDDSESVDWVALDERGAEARPASAVARLSPASSSRVLLKGGCDLWTVNSFLGGAIKTEFTYPSPSGAEVHGDNTEILRRSSPETLREFGEIIDRLPFLDRAAYRSRLARAPKSIGTMIYSVLMDYAQGVYRLRGTDFAVPYEQFDIDATDESNWPHLEERWGDVGIDRPFLEWFAERFDYEGPQSEEGFKDNIRWMAGRLSDAGARLIILNGAEVPFEHRRGWEPDRHLHHKRMNEVLEEVVAELPNAAICDVRPFVTVREDLKDNLRHYTRQAYMRIAEHLAELVGSDLAVERRPFFSRLHRARRRIARKIDHAALRYRLR
jgi:FkbH-like protein